LTTKSTKKKTMIGKKLKVVCTPMLQQWGVYFSRMAEWMKPLKCDGTAGDWPKEGRPAGRPSADHSPAIRHNRIPTTVEASNPLIL
jgi:hypothetical protein